MAVKVRRATLQDAAAIARVHVDTWRSAYHGIMTDVFLSTTAYNQRQRDWESTLLDLKGATTVFVAEDDGGHVVGFAACGPARDSAVGFGGELYAIYVTQSVQGKGAGRRLVLSTAQNLRSQGFDSMLVWVLADNPYRRFYERIGGTQVLTRDVVIGGKTLKELGYGWNSLDSLIACLEDTT